jgi:hypothetical protein
VHFINLITMSMTQGCRQANLAARGNKINIFGLLSDGGLWQAGGMASDAKSGKNPVAVALGRLGG